MDESKPKECPKCKMGLHTRNAKFCWQCGEELVERTVCDCGYEKTLLDRFCPMCGKHLREVAHERV